MAEADVDALKARGNECFKKGDFKGAVAAYDAAIGKAPTGVRERPSRSRTFLLKIAS